MPSRNCFLNAILKQVHAPSGYHAEMLRMAIAVHLVKYADEFFALMEGFLQKKKLTFVDYVYAVARGEVWADEYMMAALSQMWNVAISLISPWYSHEWKIFHKREVAHIYVVGNGYRFRCHQQATHFSGTESTMSGYRKVGSDVHNANIIKRVTREQEKIAGTRRYLLVERERLLCRHYNIGVTLQNLEDSLEVCKATLKCVEGELSECQISKEELLKYKEFQDSVHRHSRQETAVYISPAELQNILKDEGGQKRDAEDVEVKNVKKVKNITAKDEAEAQVEVKKATAKDEGEQAAAMEFVVEEVIIDDFQATTEEEPQNTAATEVVVEEVIIDTEETPQDTVVDFSTIKVVSISNPGHRRKSRKQSGPVPKEKQILGRKYCDKCGKDYKEQKALNRHQKYFCGVTEKKFKCGQCTQKYHHKEGLMEHLAAVHGGDPPTSVTFV